MIFKTMKEYDDKIKELNEKIDRYNQFVKTHPERGGVKGNIKTLKFIRQELITEKNKLVSINKEEWHFHLQGTQIKNHSVYSETLIKFIQKVVELNYTIIRSLKEGPEVRGKFSKEFKDDFGLYIRPFSLGSFDVVFEPNNSVDNQTLFKSTWNKEAFDKLFELMECGDDLDKIHTISTTLGTSSIVKYKEFLNLVSSKKLDIVIEEKGFKNHRFVLKNDDAKEIYNSIKGFDENNSEELELTGTLVAADLVKFRFGFISDSDERIDGKFPEGLKKDIKNKYGELCTLHLRKINKYNSKSGDYKDSWELIEFLD